MNKAGVQFSTSQKGVFVMYFKRFLPLILLGVSLLVFVLSCAGPVIDQNELNELVQNATDYLNSGDIDNAKSAFEDVLKKDPQNPEANAGMSVILLYEIVQEYYDEISDIANQLMNFFGVANPLDSQTNPLSLAGQLFVKMNILRLRQQNPIEIWNDSYQNIADTLSRLHPELKKIEKHLECAITKDETITLYLNRLDWDGDGNCEPNAPLIFTDGSSTFTALDLIRGNVNNLHGIPEIDKSGGDAWFDFETLLAGQNNENVSFDDNDYLLLDKGEFSAMLFVVKTALSFSDLLITWDLTIPSDLPLPSDSQWLEAILNYLDTNKNGIIDNTGDGGEWNNLNPLWTFKSNGSEYLKDLSDSILKVIQSILWLNQDITEDNPGDLHNITRYTFIEPFLDENIKSKLQNIVNTRRVNLEDVFGQKITFPYKMTQTETKVATITALDLGVLKDNPSRFQNLKFFFPTVYFSSGYFEFKDPTFGGFLVIER